MSDGNIDNTNDGASLSSLEFAAERHNLITDAAFRLLEPEAKARVEELLAAGSTPVGDWGEWADRIKGGGGPTDPETVQFKDDPANDPHDTWHYVNLPLASGGYKSAAEMGFTRDDDVVQTIRKCILVLKGESDRFSEVNALRLVGHHVGDLHQPLHVGCGYVDGTTNPPTLLFDPQEIIDRGLQDLSDRGGNNIKLLPNTGSMHGFWDGDVGGSMGNIDLEAADDFEERKENVVREILERAEALGAAEESTGALEAVVPIEDRAVEWADGSLELALGAYQNITVKAKTGFNKYNAEFKTTRAAYIQMFRPLIINQMALGARRLAGLLNELFASPGDN